MAPALLLLVGLVVGAGRIALAEQAVQQAAAQAARDTSLARTPSAGVTAGRATAARVLSGQGLDCTSSSTSVSAAALGYPPGQPGTVTVDTTCRVAAVGPGSARLPRRQDPLRRGLRDAT